MYEQGAVIYASYRFAHFWLKHMLDLVINEIQLYMDLDGF